MTRPHQTIQTTANRVVSSIGALAVVGLLMLTVALPATAPGAGAQDAGVRAEVGGDGAEVQGLEVAEDAHAVGIARDDYEVTTYAEQLRSRYGGSFLAAATASWSGPVRWPFPTVVRMTDGFGPRVSPCAGCSTMHRGIDLLPGSGAPIFAIADGVVSSRQESASYGQHVYIDHTIDGRAVTSLYAHMQWGSSPLRAGDRVSVGQFVGLVGSTGATTAPHLHLEIAVDGVEIDPLAWLNTHTSR